MRLGMLLLQLLHVAGMLFLYSLFRGTHLLLLQLLHPASTLLRQRLFLSVNQFSRTLQDLVSGQDEHTHT